MVNPPRFSSTPPDFQERIEEGFSLYTSKDYYLTTRFTGLSAFAPYQYTSARRSATRSAGAEHDQMIEALAANRPDNAFHVGALPRRPWCREHFLDAQFLDLSGEIVAENAVAIAK